MSTTDPPRPDRVPAEAWWSPEDNEWIFGNKDSDGRLTGMVKYWRPDGTLCNDCEFVDGVPHGWSLRYHENGDISQRQRNEHGKIHGLREWFWTDGHTTEKVRAKQLSMKIWRSEMDYVHGMITAFRYYDREGNDVGMDGERLPPRPAGVPANALRSTKGAHWFAGTWNGKGNAVGLVRRWTDKGLLYAEEQHEGESVAVTEYRRDDRSLWLKYVRKHVRIDGEALAWRRDGTPWVRAWFGAGESRIEHLAADGSVVRRAEYAPQTIVSADVPQPSEEEQLVFDSIAEGDASALDVLDTLSPAGMGRAIARAWAGDDERDASVARQMRRLVRKLAPASLTDVLARLQLDRSPRWQTPVRVANDLRELSADPAVNADTLRDAVIASGGPGTMLALSDPDRAYAYLESRRNESMLNLARLGLTELPPTIGRFHTVERINGENNRLVTLPDEVGDMFELFWLHLGNNRIRSLPRTLAWLPWLRTLYLSNNGLEALPSTVFELAELRVLSVGDNEIEELPEAIGDLVALEDLSLYDNKLRDLPKSLARLPLTFLHLGDHGWADPPAVLAEIRTLETLWIASPSLERLPAEIVTLPRLRELMLWHSNVSAVPPELFEATHLEELRISSNPLPAGTIEKLKEALPNCKIY